MLTAVLCFCSVPKSSAHLKHHGRLHPWLQDLPLGMFAVVNTILEEILQDDLQAMQIPQQMHPV